MPNHALRQDLAPANDEASRTDYRPMVAALQAARLSWSLSDMVFSAVSEPFEMSRRREKRRIAEGGLPSGAVAADVSQQVSINTYGPPKTFYIDTPFTCRDCGREEVWTAKQQKWYYEVAKGSLHATAVRCRECRKRLKRERQIQRQHMDAASEGTEDEP